MTPMRRSSFPAHTRDHHNLQCRHPLDLAGTFGHPDRVDRLQLEPDPKSYASLTCTPMPPSQVSFPDGVGQNLYDSYQFSFTASQPQPSGPENLVLTSSPPMKNLSALNTQAYTAQQTAAYLNL